MVYLNTRVNGSLYDRDGQSEGDSMGELTRVKGQYDRNEHSEGGSMA